MWGAGGLLHHVRIRTEVRSHVGAGLKNGKARSTFTLPCPPWAFSGHSLSDQLSVFSTFSESQDFNVSLPCLAIKNYGPLCVFLISHVSIPIQLDAKKSHAYGHVGCAMHNAPGIAYSVSGITQCDYWEETLPGRKHCLTQPYSPEKRTAMLIKTRGLTDSSPSSTYSVHGGWQA